MKRYNVYKIQTKEYYESPYSTKRLEKHKLIFLKRFDTKKEAYLWLEENRDIGVEFTILPVYIFV